MRIRYFYIASGLLLILKAFIDIPWVLIALPAVGPWALLVLAFTISIISTRAQAKAMLKRTGRGF
jgi:hypothetical protein